VNNIERQLSQADPLNHVALHALPDSAVKALAQEIVMHEQATVTPLTETPEEVRAARPRRRRRLMAGLFAGLIIVPTTAAAVVGGMHTGFLEPSPPEGFSSMGTVGEEWLNTGDPEIRTVVQDLTTEIPLPAGASYAALLAMFPTKEKAFEQRTGIGGQVASYAECAWFKDWIEGDAAQRARDQPTIDAMSTWKYWNFAIDAATGHNSGLEGQKRIAAETRAGITTNIRLSYDANCTGKSPEHAAPSGSPSP
jgi:hypothetical protein